MIVQQVAQKLFSSTLYILVVICFACRGADDSGLLIEFPAFLAYKYKQHSESRK